MQLEEWVDVTKIGSQYEEQLEIHSGKKRYRPLKLVARERKLFEELGIGEWNPGLPPNAEVSRPRADR